MTTTSFDKNTRTIVHATKFYIPAPNYFMFDIMMKNRSGAAYLNKIPVVIYGVKGCHNDFPVSFWDKL